MRSHVADILERFLIRQENEVTRIPRALRSLTVGEFADKYDGSIAACLQGMAQARIESAQDSDLAGGKRYAEHSVHLSFSGTKYSNPSRRKWQNAQNPEVTVEAEGSRAPKTGVSLFATLALRPHRNSFSQLARSRRRPLLSAPMAPARLLGLLQRTASSPTLLSQHTLVHV